MERPPPTSKTVPCACRSPSTVHTHTLIFIYPKEKELGWEERARAELGCQLPRPAGEALSSHPKERRSPCEAKAVPICSAWVTPVAIFIRACLQGSGRFILGPLS